MNSHSIADLDFLSDEFHCETEHSPLEVFQELAMGGLLLTEKLPCLADWGLECGKHYLGYPADDHESLMEQIDLVMQEPEAFKDIRENARKFAHEKNTYVDRLHQMFREVGLE